MSDALNQLMLGVGLATRHVDAIGNDRSEQVGLLKLREINRDLQRFIDRVDESAASERVFEALIRFRKNWSFESAKDARLVCAQIHVPSLGSRDEPIRLLEDDTWYGQVIDRVEHVRAQQPRLFRRCYRGLLTGYFECDPDDTGLRDNGRRNWVHLREYLCDRTSALRINGTDPTWVTVIETHQNLLTEDPCSRYAKAALAGNEDEWQTVRDTFGLTGSMWLVRRFMEARVDAAVTCGDSEFLALVPLILELLGRTEYDSLMDNGLAKLLDRYRKVRQPVVHPQLRDTSTGRWHSPILASNSGNWSRVHAATRDMVADWIKLETIQQFFEFLADEGATDKRRVRYWEKRYKQIDQFWLALGNRAMYSTDPDFKKLRTRMRRDGLVKELRNDEANNAIIMKIGDLLVVEFSKTGNACYAYRDGGRLPFRLEETSYSTAQLKHPSKLKWLTHMHDWESKFDQFLSEQGFPAPRTLPRTVDPKEFSDEAFHRFILRHGLQVTDNRHRGGVLKIVAGRITGTVETQLDRWGFEYSTTAGWWKGAR